MAPPFLSYVPFRGKAENTQIFFDRRLYRSNAPGIDRSVVITTTPP